MSTRLKIADEKEKMIVSKMGWGDVHGDLLRGIFGLLSPNELVPMTLVCPWWRSVCVDTLFWKDQESPQLNNLELFLGQEANSEKLLRGLQLVMDPTAAELRQQCVRKIRFPYIYNVYYEHLNFLAERSPKLKKVKMLCPLYTRTTDITEAIQKWEDLEHLVAAPFHNSIIRNFIPAIGRSCKNLTVLHLHGKFSYVSDYRFTLNADNASLITKNLRQLRVFKLNDALIFKPGLQIILSECEQLVALRLKKCYRVVDDLELSFECLRSSITMNAEKVVADDSIGWSIDSREKIDAPEEVVNDIWSIAAESKKDIWMSRNNGYKFKTVKKYQVRRNGYTLIEMIE